MVAQHVNLVITYFTALWTGNVSRYGLLAAPWNISLVYFTPRALQFGFGFVLGSLCFGLLGIGLGSVWICFEVDLV